MVPNPKVEIESKENAQTKRNLEMKMQETESEAHRQTSPTEYKRQKTDFQVDTSVKTILNIKISRHKIRRNSGTL